MAETLTRSQLIQQQIENLLKNAPPAITEAERNQIMKGRKKQSDIDAGRAAIDARAKEVSDYNGKLDRLTAQLGDAQREEKTGAEKAKREEGSDPVKNIAIPSGIGLTGGLAGSYGLNKIVGLGDADKTRAITEIGNEIGPTKDLTNSQMNRSRAVGAAKAAELYAPPTGLGKAGALVKRGLTYGLPAGIVGYEYERYKSIADDENRPWDERQAANRMANGYLGVASGIGAEGSARFLNKRVGKGEGESMMRIEAARDYARRMDEADARPKVERPAMPPAGTSSSFDRGPMKTIDAEVIPEPVAPPTAAPQKALPPPDAEVAEPTMPKTTRSHSDRLISAAKAADGTGIKSKGSAAEWLQAPRNITPDNRAAVAKELGVKPGANFEGRILTAVKNMAKKPGAFSLVGPLTAGAVAYAGTPSRAEASDGTPIGGTDEALTNAAVVGGGTYGLGKAMDVLPKVAKSAAGAGMSMLTPAMAADAYDPTPEKLNQDRLDFANMLPSWARVGKIGEEYDMSQVPERNMGKKDEFAMARQLEIPDNIDPDAAWKANAAAEFDPRQHAVDTAMNIVRRANGGRVSSGGFHHDGGGRTDNLPLDVTPGTYIVPADIVSALGQGNTMAGIKVLDNMFPPEAEGPSPKKAAGGRTGNDGTVPIIVAGGEFRISPYHVAALGSGDVRQGADALDAWVNQVRQDHIDTLSSLPGPAQ